MEISSWYEQRRNDLLKLIDESKSIDIPERYAKELSFVQKKCSENMFEIVFLGEFQGGKSTTFNALCDGRDLSPRGIGGGGIKTSAAVISAQNISGEETKEGMSEWAEISYKTEEDLVKITFDIVVKYGTEITKNIFQGDKPFSNDYNDKVKLSDSNHRKWLKQDIEQIWKIYERDKLNFSHDDLDMLRISTIIVKYFGTPEYTNAIKKQTSSIDKFQRLVQFPSDWEKKWEKGYDADFSFAEVSFVFVAAVLLRIKYNNLARLGCRITDCPGLFANKYDTDVAIDAIRMADAVLYLIDGGKQCGYTCLKSIKYIKDSGMLDKIFIAANLRGSHDFAKQMIIPASQALLGNNGIKTNIHPYNARLAFLAMQGDQIFRNPGCLTDLDYNNIIADAKSEDIDSSDVREIWPQFIANSGFNCKVKELREVEELNEESLKLVNEHSGFGEIFSALESDIITKKSRSILYDNGSHKIVTALKAYEDNLQALENSLKENEEKVEYELNSQRDLLEAFLFEANEKINKERAEVESIHAENFANTIINETFNDDFYDRASFELACIFDELNSGFYLNRDRFAFAVAEKSRPVLDELITTSVNSSVQKFIEPCEKLKMYFDKLNRLVYELNRHWENQNLNEKCYLSGLNNNIFCSIDEIIDSNAYSSQIVNMVLSHDEIKTIISNLYKTLWTGFGKVITSPIRWIGKLVGVGNKNSPLPRAKIQKNIKTQLFSSIDEVRKNMVDELANKLISTIIEPRFSTLSENVLNISSLFENERVKPIQENLNKAKNEKEAAIAENNHIRTQQIMPFRKEVESFERKIKSEMKKLKIKF